MIVTMLEHRFARFTVAVMGTLSILGASVACAEDVEKLKTGVVKITSHIEEKRRVGTGFIVRLEPKAAYIVTASHVVEGDPEPPQVTFCVEPAHSFAAKVIGMEGGDPTGLAALVVEADLPAGLRALAIDETNEVKSGDPVTVIGFPVLLGTPWTVVEGQISGFKGRALTFQAPIEEGNSGGPLLRNGKVVGVITEKREAFGSATNAVVAQVTLKGWGVESQAELESPVALSGMLSNSGWIITIRIADKAREIFYRIGDAPTFKSTGMSRNLDRQTGLPIPNSYIIVGTEQIADKMPIQIKYQDQRGREKGPFVLSFDPKGERLREVKEILNDDTPDRWLEFNFSGGELIVYFSHLLSYRDGLKEIRYSVDNQTLSEHFPFEPWSGSGTPEMDSDAKLSLEVPVATDYVAVKLTYLDGSESEPKTFRKPKGMAAEEGVDDLKKRLAADTNFVKSKDDDGRTPLHLAAEEGQVGAVKLLLAAGAAVDARDDSRQTPLHRAAEEGHAAQAAVAEILLAHNADANARDNSGDVPLHLAAAAGNAAFVELLLAHKADVNAVGHDKNTPLHEARSTATAAALLAAHAQVDARNYYEQTPLYRAADDGRTDLAEILIASKADINARDNSDETPLYAAAEEGHADMVRFLPEKGADPNAKTDRAMMPLHVAAEKGHAEIVQILLAGRADVNARDDDQETPLHVAAEAGDRDVVEVLLTNKADVNAKDREGKTPLDLADAEGAAEVVGVLRARLGMPAK